MRALEIDRGQMRLVERPLPAPPAGEARVRVQIAGICSTDLQLLAGYMDFHGVAGHEFVGRVEEAPSSPGLVGETVVGEINAGCGGCDLCRAGDARHCPDRTVLGIAGRGGAFAEQLLLPVGNLRIVPGSVPAARAVFTEPLAAAFEILEQIEVKKRRALVIGCGRLGSLCARVLQGAGADVNVATRRRGTARFLERDGFRVVALGARCDYDIVVDATGRSEGFALALEQVRPRGTIVLKTTAATAGPLNLAPVVIDEVTVVGSRCGPFAPALEALERGTFRPEETIGGRYALDEFEAAFAAAKRPADPARRKILLELS